MLFKRVLILRVSIGPLAGEGLDAAVDLADDEDS